MPSRRMIDPATWQSESIAEFTRDQRLLFIGLFSNADDQGRLRGNPNLVRSVVFPFDDDLNNEIIADWLKVIAKEGCIILYEIDGKEYIQITHWWEYQFPQWAYPSKFPAPPGWTDRLRYRKDNSVVTYNWRKGGDNGSPPDFPDETPPNPSPNGLGKNLPKDLPNGLGGLIELGIGIEIDIDNSKAEKEAEAAFLRNKVTDIWQSNINVGGPGSILADKIVGVLFKVPGDSSTKLIWFREALARAKGAGVPTWNYMQAILNSWIEKGEIEDKPNKKRDEAKAEAEKSPLPPSPDLPPAPDLPPWVAIWQQAQAILQGQMSKQTFDTWLRLAEAKQNTNGTFVLNAKSKEAKELIDKRLGKQVLQALQCVKPEIHNLQVVTK